MKTVAKVDVALQVVSAPEARCWLERDSKDYIYAEAVATDGPITEARRGLFIELVTAAGFKASQIAFVTAFQDRNAPAFKKAIPNLAWGSFAWCLSEPEHLIALDGTLPRGIRLLSDFNQRS